MKNRPPVKSLGLIFLLACFCLAGSSFAGEFQPTGPSSIAAIAAGKGAEFLSAMESTASEAEKNAAASSSPRQHWAEASAAYGEASWAARSIGQLQKSLSYAERALETAEKAQSPMLQARAIYRLTAVHTALRQHLKAKQWAERGLKTTPQLEPGPVREALEGEFYRLLGLDALRAGDLGKAIELLSHSLRIQESRVAFFESARRLGPTGSQALSAARHHVLYSLNNLGAAYSSAGRPDDAIRTYEKGIALIKKTGVKTSAEGNLYHGLGEVYFGQKNYPRALENLRAALRIGEEQREDAVIYAANKQLGDLHRETRKPDDAMAYYRKAVDTVESTRSLLQSEDTRQSFFEGRLDAYHGMIGVLFESGKAEEAFNYSERARSRVFLDLVGSKAQLSRTGSGLLEEELSLQARLASVQARLASEAGAAAPELRKELEQAEAAYEAFLQKVRKENREQASLMSVEPLGLSEVQRLLDPGTTLIEYFITESDVLIWVVEGDKTHAVKQSLSKGELSRLVKTLRETIPVLGEREKLDQLSMTLYAQLVEPVLPQVTGKELVIVPHDVLHYLPFHALRSRDGTYLIEKYPVTYLSSASLLQFVREKRKAKGEKVLAFGNPDLGDLSMNLRFAEREAREIQRLYPQSTLLVRQEATEEKGKSLSPPFDIIHFATHAELMEDNPLSTAILLASEGKEDGRLEVKEIFQLDLKAGLVVLSACETGLGKLSTGDELVGLTRAFIYAGTPTVVASLWKVQDMSTTELMAAFYKNLRTMNKVEALRQAQLGLIRNRDAAGSHPTSHPYFWAPFVLVGDGK